MGKQTKLREAQRRAAEQALAARLRLHGRVERRPAFIASCDEFPPRYLTRLNAYRRFAHRAPEEWRCKLRIRCPEQRFLELVRFTFARFSVPAHLESAWLEDIDCGAVPRLDLRRWYIIAAQGGSLFKDNAHQYLSRAETHHFLNPPSKGMTAQQALWYAVARTQTDDALVATRIARTKIAGFPISYLFWKEVARYFARNPISILEMNDLIDYLHAVRTADRDFSVSGRSLRALRQRMEEWHRILRAGEGFCHIRWTGRPLANAAYEIDGVIWRFKQIKNGVRLFEEGERMRHCVLSYKQLCVRGETSIWSLTREDAGSVYRCLTIEVSHSDIVLQCRGFANRRPSDQECAIVQRWAREHALSWLDLEARPPVLR